EWEGRPARLVLAHDVTSRLRAEEAVKQSEAKYRELFENANDVIYTHDLEGNFTSLNRTGEHITGYSEAEVLQLNVADIVVPEYLERARQMIRRKVEEGSPPTIYETVVIAKDGRRIPLEINTRLILEDGKPVGIQGIGRDISERLAAQEALRSSEEQLRQAQKLESIGILAGGMAHDFNNMLTAINGYSDLVLRKLSPDDPIRKNVEEIRKAGERSAELTRQLLAFSRRQILQPQALNLNETIEETTSLLRRLIGEDITVTTRLHADLWKVEADPGQLSQVLMNLAINARDAMPKGGSLMIETSNVVLDEKYASRHVEVAPGRYVMFAVSDTGLGMDEETKRRVFEPFFTTKSVGRGTGLGLSTVYGIVKQSGGNIWVYSEPDRGTTFKIYLPEAGAENYGDDLEISQHDLHIGSETILLVEDESSVRGLACEILEACGYTVVEAEDGKEALKRFGQIDSGVDLLITDVVMPNMGGRELSENLLLACPDMKVLFTSGYTDDAILRHGITDENTNFLQKPFTFASLSRKVRLLLDNK
ncbi:MAG TPA: PAS domain S-box protein, partial [Pyrinomonadaceae bacterium]